MQKSFLINNIDEMKVVAQKIVSELPFNSCVLLVGDLGAGKTTFAKYAINSIIPDSNVVSPTFPIVNIYNASEMTVAHFDLYRIKNSEELLEIGFTDLVNLHMSFIEWPEIAFNYLPRKYILIKIDLIDDFKRILKVNFYGH